MPLWRQQVPIHLEEQFPKWELWKNILWPSKFRENWANRVIQTAVCRIQQTWLLSQGGESFSISHCLELLLTINGGREGAQVCAHTCLISNTLDFRVLGKVCFDTLSSLPLSYNLSPSFILRQFSLSCRSWPQTCNSPESASREPGITGWHHPMSGLGVDSVFTTSF